MQILKLGQLVILSVPTELTTMAGRRMRDRLKQANDPPSLPPSLPHIPVHALPLPRTPAITPLLTTIAGRQMHDRLEQVVRLRL